MLLRHSFSEQQDKESNKLDISILLDSSIDLLVHFGLPRKVDQLRSLMAIWSLTKKFESS